MKKEDRDNRVLQLYSTGLTMRQVAAETNVHHNTIQYIIKTAIKKYPDNPYVKIIIKRHVGVGERYRKYRFDDHFFDRITCETQAYWLGFLYADGTVLANRVILDLADKDRLRLERFATDIHADNLDIRHRDDVNSNQVILNSTKLSNALIQLGCFVNKTYKLQFPTETQVPTDLIHHFMRGYFDGDGCVYQSKEIPSQVCFQVIGTNAFIDMYQRILHIVLQKPEGHGVRKYRDNERLRVFHIGGRIQLRSIFDFLYRNATVFLERKKSIFDDMFRPSSSESY